MLEGESSRGGKGTRGLKGAVTDRQTRGNKRHKSWIAGGGKWGHLRDLGMLNAELAEEVGGIGIGGESMEVEVEVDAVHVMEAVRMPGSKNVVYESLLSIPLRSTTLGAQAPAPESQDAAPAAPAGNASSGGDEVQSNEGDGDSELLSRYGVSSSPSLSDSARASLYELLQDDFDSD